MTPHEDPSIQVRLELAEIKGMLTVSLQNHGERIATTEGDIDKLHSRMNHAGARLTTIEEQSKTSQHDRSKLHRKIGHIEERLQGQFGRSLQTAVGIVAVLGFIISVSGIF